MSERLTWRTGFASIGRAVTRGATYLSDVATDFAALTGVGFVSYGAGLIYRPAGFIVLGLLLIVGAFLAAKGKR